MAGVDSSLAPRRTRSLVAGSASPIAIGRQGGPAPGYRRTSRGRIAGPAGAERMRRPIPWVRSLTHRSGGACGVAGVACRAWLVGLGKGVLEGGKAPHPPSTRDAVTCAVHPDRRRRRRRRHTWSEPKARDDSGQASLARISIETCFERYPKPASNESFTRSATRTASCVPLVASRRSARGCRPRRSRRRP